MIGRLLLFWIFVQCPIVDRPQSELSSGEQAQGDPWAERFGDESAGKGAVDGQVEARGKW